MNAGELVPDEVILGMIGARIGEQDAREGFLLDGFPRNDEPGRRARARRSASPSGRLTAVLLIEVPDEEVVRRLAGRRVCVKNGHVYHVEFDPPKHEGICDQDGSRLIQRDDDKEQTIRRRLEVYHAQDRAADRLLRRGRACCAASTGSAHPDEVHDHIRATVATLRLEDKL